MKFLFPYWIRTLLALASIASFALAQHLTTAPSDSSGKPVTTQTKTRVTPGIQYDAGWLHRLFAGAHLAGERSKKWHSALGGGLWLNAINRFVLNLSVGRSPEEVRFYLTSGFGF